jgi:hypothetical protein
MLSCARLKLSMSDETYLQYLPGDFIQIRGPNGTKVITVSRLAEIFAESYRIGRWGAGGGTKEQCRKVFDRLIEQEIAAP